MIIILTCFGPSSWLSSYSSSNEANASSSIFSSASASSFRVIMLLLSLPSGILRFECRLVQRHQRACGRRIISVAAWSRDS